ncbi:MAG TPA: hypothetical protein VGB30_14345 [bacterium]|jgi:hypothetical protein
MTGQGRERIIVREEITGPGREGWILQIYLNDPSPRSIQIFSFAFNYDYLNDTPPSWREGFPLLLKDLAQLIPDTHTNAGFKSAMDNARKPDDENVYEDVEEMEDRARYEMTLLRTRGYI